MQGLADLIEPGGEIILSGILQEQGQSVIEAAQARGLKMNEKRQMGGLDRIDVQLSVIRVQYPVLFTDSLFTDY